MHTAYTESLFHSRVPCVKANTGLPLSFHKTDTLSFAITRSKQNTVLTETARDAAQETDQEQV